MRMKTRTLSQFLVGIGLLMSASYSNAALVSYWNFDDGATASDLAGANNGELKNGAGFSANVPAFASGRTNVNSLDLSNGKDYVLLPRNNFGIGATSSFTISTWANYTSSERGAITIMQDLTSGGGDRSGITLGMGGDNNVFVGIIASSGVDDAVNGGATFRDVTADQTIPTNQWVHLAATLVGDTLTTYLDGIPAVSYVVNPAGSTMQPDGSNVTGGVGIDFDDANGSFTGFGASGNAPAVADSPGDFTRLFYEGLLDDISIWDQGLSADSIQRLARGESPIVVPEPSSALLFLYGSLATAFLRRRPIISRTRRTS